VADFDTSADFVLKQEGGMSNRPDDSGGETKYGVSKKSFPDVDVANLTPDAAKELYRNYWLFDWSVLPQNEATLLLSLSINMGLTQVVSLTQKALGIIVDGKWGEMTQSAVLRTPNAGVYIAGQAIKFYESLNKPEFMNGWVMRVLEALCS
jgi:lysozyme family protein